MDLMPTIERLLNTKSEKDARNPALDIDAAIASQSVVNGGGGGVSMYRFLLFLTLGQNSSLSCRRRGGALLFYKEKSVGKFEESNR